MFNRGIDRVKDSWKNYNKARKDFIIELLNYLFDKFSPKWLNYLLFKHKIFELSGDYNKTQAINTIELVYKREQITENQMNKLINMIDNKSFK